jgi:hypothetical protein
MEIQQTQRCSRGHSKLRGMHGDTTNGEMFSKLRGTHGDTANREILTETENKEYPFGYSKQGYSAN